MTPFQRCLAVLLLLASAWMQAQTLPTYGKVFVQDEVTRIDVTMAEADRQRMYDSNSSATTYPAEVVFSSSQDRDTLRQVGIRLRGNTSLTAAKKNLKLDLNEYEDLSLGKLEKLNLNSEKNDPTLLRSRLSLELLRAAGVMASRVAHTEVYINDVYYGLYVNTEHLDEEFIQRRFDGPVGNLYKCLFPATLEAVGDSGDDYKFEQFGRRTYELRTNQAEDDYSDLANFLTVLNTSSADDFVCALEQVFDVDAFLRVQAIDALIGNWDGYAYNTNNFYLYHDLNTGRFIYIPYDFDNTWGIDWLSKDWGTRDVQAWRPSQGARPLYDRILAVPQYRALYTYYLDTYLQTWFDEASLSGRIDQLKALTESSVANDPLRPLDFGWSLSDYDAAFTQALSPHVDYGLHTFVQTRHRSAKQQLGTYNVTPRLSDAVVDDILIGRQTAIRVRVTEDDAVDEVRFHYRSTGAWQTIRLEDHGLFEDQVAGDKVYSGALPIHQNTGNLNYYFTATDKAALEGRYPWCGSLVQPIVANSTELYLNELMADNESSHADAAGEFDDWVELYNGGDAPISLDGLYLTDNPQDTFKWALPALALAAQEYLLVWADKDEAQGQFHANFRLSADGESISLYAATGALLDRVGFGAQNADWSYARIPNGTGAFRAVDQPTPGAPNLGASAASPAVVVETFTVAPNPTQDLVSLALTLAQPASLGWQLLDGQGRLLLKQAPVEGQALSTQLDLRDYPSGTYWWVLLVEGEPKLLRAIVRR